MNTSCANKFNYLYEIDKFLERLKLPNLTQKEMENLNRPITSEKTDLVIIKLPMRPRPDDFNGEFYQIFKK